MTSSNAAMTLLQFAVITVVIAILVYGLLLPLWLAILMGTFLGWALFMAAIILWAYLADRRR